VVYNAKSMAPHEGLELMEKTVRLAMADKIAALDLTSSLFEKVPALFIQILNITLYIVGCATYYYYMM
jgi:hypothetical protein